MQSLKTYWDNKAKGFQVDHTYLLADNELMIFVHSNSHDKLEVSFMVPDMNKIIWFTERFTINLLYVSSYYNIFTGERQHYQSFSIGMLPTSFSDKPITFEGIDIHCESMAHDDPVLYKQFSYLSHYNP